MSAHERQIRVTLTPVSGDTSYISYAAPYVVVYGGSFRLQGYPRYRESELVSGYLLSYMRPARRNVGCVGRTEHWLLFGQREGGS